MAGVAMDSLRSVSVWNTTVFCHSIVACACSAADAQPGHCGLLSPTPAQLAGCILSESETPSRQFWSTFTEWRGGMLPLGNLWRCCVGLLLLAGFALAQTGSTAITGLVTDATGAAVPGASITIKRVATRESRTAVTDNAGEYVFSLIEIGEFTVKSEKPGFKTRTLTGLVMKTGQKLRADMSLDIGNVVES